MKTLKIPKNNVHLYNYKVRTFPDIRQEILEILYKLNKDYSPEIVFAPSLNDLHQDHEVVAKEAFRAFKNTTIFCYEEPWNMLNFNFTAFSILTEDHVKNKIEALQCYRSQEHRLYFQEDYQRNLAKIRGMRVHREFAEAFEVMRLFF